MANDTFDGNGQFERMRDFRKLKRGDKVFLGDKLDARNCEYLISARVEHNWPSQWHSRFIGGYLELSVDGKKMQFDLAHETIDGGPICIFDPALEIENLCTKKIAKKDNSLDFGEKLVAEGLEVARRGNFWGAAQKCKDAINLKPSNARAYSHLGYCYFKLGLYREAIRVLTVGIALTSDRWLLSRMHDARGLAKSALGDQEGGIEDFTRSLELKPNNARVLTHRGISYERAKQPDWAYTDALVALRNNPTYEAALRLRQRLENQGH